MLLGSDFASDPVFYLENSGAFFFDDGKEAAEVGFFLHLLIDEFCDEGFAGEVVAVAGDAGEFLNL